jgi:ArsR family transcriptional regulator
LIEFLKVLADQTRLDILDMLQKKKCTTSEIQMALKKSQSTVSQHLKMLNSLNLISFDREVIEGKSFKYYEIKNDEIFKLLIGIKSFVTDINKEKFKDIRDKAVKDTLL